MTHWRRGSNRGVAVVPMVKQTRSMMIGVAIAVGVMSGATIVDNHRQADTRVLEETARVRRELAKDKIITTLSTLLTDVSDEQEQQAKTLGHLEAEMKHLKGNR